MNHHFPETGSNGIPDPTQMLTKAVRKSLSPERADRARNSEEKPHAAITHVGKDCRGALNQAYNVKQPWTYKMEMIKERNKEVSDRINLLDSKEKVGIREQIHKQYLSEVSSTGFEKAEVNEQNRTTDKYTKW